VSRVLETKANEMEETAIPGLSDLYIPEHSDESHSQDIADLLLEMSVLTDEQYEQVRASQSEKLDGDSKERKDIETLLLKSGFVSNEDILKAKAHLYGMEFRHIRPKDINQGIFDNLETDFIVANGIMCVGVESDRKDDQNKSPQELLVVATCAPPNVFAAQDIKHKTKMNLKLIVCSRQDIDAACEYFKQDDMNGYVDDIISNMTNVEVVKEQEKSFEDLEKMAGQSPVIKFVNYLISNAVREGASDIHIEPKKKLTRVRSRIDGVLFDVMRSPLKMHPAVVSRVKIMCNLDISERRLPQDGKVSVIVGGRGIDLRVSTLPTNHGEKVVIRILDSKSIMLGLDELGMGSKTAGEFSEQIAMPNGIFLVTGPTGSGKSTTLYSALRQMDGDRLNISTVEDPVEYELGFCNQVQISEKIGLTFAASLRSLLRQDPDVIMIGEIRDNETARIAVQAALTGHLVLSTLHTNDAAGSITRLVNIGVDEYLIGASLNGVLAQRLVRKICPKCKRPAKVSATVEKYMQKTSLSSEQLFVGAGCDNCRGTGYSGRLGIYELLIMNDSFRETLNADSSSSTMRKIFNDSGRDTLFYDGIRKVKMGLTTLEEVLRVTEMYGLN